MTEKELDEIYEKLLHLDGREGLPEQIFLAISAIFPVPNVDLLILDEEGQILLSWRDDPYFGKGWHLPGGCLRYKETMLERVKKTALAEIGTEVEVMSVPLAVRDVILGKGGLTPRIRAHNLAVLYECRIRHDAVSEDRCDGQHKAKDLQWFPKLPPELLDVHDVYRDVFAKYSLLDMENTRA